MKRKLAVVLAGVMICATSLTGCGSKNDATNEYVKLVGYKGIEIPAVEKTAEVTDESVENYINSMINQNTVEEEVTDRPVQLGDTAIISYVGTKDGVAFEGGSAEDYPLVIGSGSFIEGFEDSIIGHNIGETFDWNGSFPENYDNVELAGQDVVFTITVNGITVYSAPELTDEFVQSVSTESTTVDEYREEVKGLLEESAELDYEYALQNSVWTAVMEKAEIVKFPEGEVEELTETLIGQYKTMAEYYGMDYETFITEQMGYTVEDFEVQAKTAAEESVKQSLVAKAIADAEKIKPSDKEYQEQYEDMCEEYGYEDVESLMEAAGGEEELKEIVLQNIVIEWLAENCIQVVE